MERGLTKMTADAIISKQASKQASVAVVCPFVNTFSVNVGVLRPFCRIVKYGHEGVMRLFDCPAFAELFQLFGQFSELKWSGY